MKLSRYDTDPQYNDPDPNYHPSDVGPNVNDIQILPKSDMQRVFNLIKAERSKQDAKWGEQDHEGMFWNLIAMEEFGEVSKAILEGDRQNYIIELIQTSAVLVAWIENELRKLQLKDVKIEDYISGK